MSTIFEIFGHRLDDTSPEAQEHRTNAWCPFMNARCDGGGNRYLTEIDLTKPEHARLSQQFPELDRVVPGVCSLQTTPHQSPWIVCPRRLLVLGRQQAGTRRYQRELETQLLHLLGYPSSTRLGIWKEVKLKHVAQIEQVAKEFDYTFDYILMPIGDIPVTELFTDEQPTPKQISEKVRSLEKRGFTLSETPDVSGGLTVHDYPYGNPSIVEIMTSSTSGGNKRNRTQIAQCFEDAVLNRPHKAPGINYRQVWARMASQLLVKSEVALGWGGLAIWVVQDVLVDYISKSTGLNMRDFITHTANEVNMLSFSYGDLSSVEKEGVIDLPTTQLFAGTIAPKSGLPGTYGGGASFSDIVRSPLQPPLTKLIDLLTGSGPARNYVFVP